MADKLIDTMFARAKNRQARRYVTISKHVSRLMPLFRGTIDALSGTLENDKHLIEAIDESVGWATLLKVRHEVAAIAEAAGEDPLIVAIDRYATLRKFAPALIEALECKAGRGSARSFVTIRILRELNRSRKRDVPPGAPMPSKKEVAQAVHWVGRQD